MGRGDKVIPAAWLEQEVGFSKERNCVSFKTGALVPPLAWGFLQWAGAQVESRPMVFRAFQRDLIPQLSRAFL